MTDTPKSSAPRLTRREMLKLSSALGAGALLAACAAPATPSVPTVAPTEALARPTEAPAAAPPSAAPVQGKVIVMQSGNEFDVEQDLAAFLEANPGLEIETLEVDFPRFFEMYAAGNPPD